MSNNGYLPPASPAAHDDAALLVERTIVVACELVLGVALLWLLASVAVCTVDALRGASGTATGTLLRPRLVRVVVAAAVGSCCAAGPSAHADGPELPRALDGLALPDRTFGGVPTHEIAPGETLWSIAVERLPARPVTEAWPRIYRLNQRRIGPDPDLVHPGTTLRLPARATVRPNRGEAR